MTQYGHGGQHHGTGAPGCPVDLHHHHDERCEVPIIVTAAEIVNGVEVPIGKPRERTISRGALNLLHGHNTSTDEALADRRQRAREAFWDGHAEREPITMANVEAAIETATRVRIDDDVLGAALAAVSAGPGARPRYINAIKAAFLAAGFEVEQ